MFEQGLTYEATNMDIEAEGRLLDVVLSGYEKDELDLRDPEFVSGLKDVCEDLTEEGRREEEIKDLLRGALIDAEALKRHIGKFGLGLGNPNETGRALPLNTQQLRFISNTMTKAYLPYMNTDGTYDMKCGANRANTAFDQLCRLGYDSEAVKLLSAEALIHTSRALSSITTLSPEVFND